VRLGRKWFLEMDDIDRKILALYQCDTRRIAASIGEEVGLSAAAVQRRLKRLRAEGTITAEIAVLDNAIVGRPITCVVNIVLGSSAAQIDRFTRKMRTQRDVQQCYHVTGSVDVVLIVTAQSMEAYRSFARTWLETPQVARYETHVVLDRIKVGLSVPLFRDRGD
jgi:Lrp/AsnC family transcriptional regulator, leucine-responsive regulatory protein